MIKLYIDDIREPKMDGYIIVRSYADAINYMRQNGCPDFISFDHDLGNTNDLTGFDVAKWIVSKDLDSNGTFIPTGFTFNVHSANPVGSQNINGLLDNYLKVKSDGKDN